MVGPKDLDRSIYSLFSGPDKIYFISSMAMLLPVPYPFIHFLEIHVQLIFSISFYPWSAFLQVEKLTAMFSHQSPETG